MATKDRHNRSFLTVAETARELGLSYPGTMRRITDGRMPAQKVGSMWLVSRESVAEQLRNPPHRGRPKKHPQNLRKA